MFHFFLTFIYALVVYDAGPPPVVGIGADYNTAIDHINFLKTCYGLDWNRAQSNEKTSWQIRGGYTICKTNEGGKIWLTCLVGNALSPESIETGIRNLLATYDTVFDGRGQRKPNLPANVTPIKADLQQSTAQTSQFQKKAEEILKGQGTPEPGRKLTTVSSIPVVVGSDGHLYTIVSTEICGSIKGVHPLLIGTADRGDSDMQRQEANEELAGYFEGNQSFPGFKAAKDFFASSAAWEEPIYASETIQRISWHHKSFDCKFYTRRGVIFLPASAFGIDPKDEISIQTLELAFTTAQSKASKYRERKDFKWKRLDILLKNNNPCHPLVTSHLTDPVLRALLKAYQEILCSSGQPARAA